MNFEEWMKGEWQTGMDHKQRYFMEEAWNAALEEAAKVAEECGSLRMDR